MEIFTFDLEKCFKYGIIKPVFSHQEAKITHCKEHQAENKARQKLPHKTTKPSPYVSKLLPYAAIPQTLSKDTVFRRLSEDLDWKREEMGGPL